MSDELRNSSENEFTDISSEEYRIYKFEQGGMIRIDAPLFLSVSASGGHRILDNCGVCHYIPFTWIHLSWKVKEGSPHFVK